MYLIEDAKVTTGSKGIRLRSSATLFGLPVLAISLGPDPDKQEERGHAVGIIAIGDFATGGLAIGGIAMGVVSLGGVSLGIFAFGGVAVGVAAIAGVGVADVN